MMRDTRPDRSDSNENVFSGLNNKNTVTMYNPLLKSRNRSYVNAEQDRKHMRKFLYRDGDVARTQKGFNHEAER